MKTCLIYLIIALQCQTLFADSNSLNSLIEQRHKILLQLEQERLQWIEEEFSFKSRLLLLQEQSKTSRSIIKEQESELQKLTLEKAKIIAEHKRQSDIQKKLELQLANSMQAMATIANELPPQLIEQTPTYKDWQRQLKKLPNLELKAAQRIFLKFYKEIQALQKKVNSTTQIVTIAGKEQEAHAIFLGTATGFYLTHDQLHAGTIEKVGTKWQALSNDSLAPRIAKLRDSLKSGSLLELIELPLPGAQK